MPTGIYKHKKGVHPKSEFKKGHIPWCKGKKGTYSMKHSRQFKKGHTPWNKGKSNIYSQELIEHLREIGKRRGSPMLGKRHSEKAKIKMSESHKNIYPFWLKDKKLSKDFKKRISEILTGKYGEKSRNWKGGISFEPYSPEFNKKLKNFIRRRDNYTCQFSDCGVKQNGRAHSVHHIDYNKKNVNPLNLILLCVKCNSKVNANRNYWTKCFKNLIKRRYQNGFPRGF